MCPKTVVERWASFVKNLSQDKYGHTPDIRISGTNTSPFGLLIFPTFGQSMDEGKQLKWKDEFDCCYCMRGLIRGARMISYLLLIKAFYRTR